MLIYQLYQAAHVRVRDEPGFRFREGAPGNGMPARGVFLGLLFPFLGPLFLKIGAAIPVLWYQFSWPMDRLNL